VTEGGPAELVMAAPTTANLSLADLRFRVLAQRSTAAGGLASPVELGNLSVQRPSDTQATTFGIADKQSAVVVSVQMPQEHFRIWPIWNNYSLSVAVCGKDSAAGPIATAQRLITVSNTSAARVWAWALIVALYMTAATCVYLARKQLVKDSGKPATAPVRLQPVQPWPWLKCMNPVMLTSDMFDRGSLSQFQVLFFTGIVIFGLVDLNLATRSLSDLSPSVVFLLGLPAAGTLGAQIASGQRDRLSVDNWSWLVSRGILPLNDPGTQEPRWVDLVMQDSVLDLSKLQALGFSVVVGGAMIVEGFSTLRTFVIPSALLQVLGLSQLVFVGGRFTKPATMGDLDGLITKLRNRHADLRHAAVTGVDVTATGDPGTGAPVQGAPFQTFAQARAGLANAGQRYVDVAKQVEALLDVLSHRSVDKTKIDNPDL
jgi:hypothetical protein